MKLKLFEVRVKNGLNRYVASVGWMDALEAARDSLCGGEEIVGFMILGEVEVVLPTSGVMPEGKHVVPSPHFTPNSAVSMGTWRCPFGREHPMGATCGCLVPLTQEGA